MLLQLLKYTDQRPYPMFLLRADRFTLKHTWRIS